MQQEDHQPPVQPSKPDFWRDPRPTNENPNFVRDYFASSRLHFIGSFRARYESMMVAVGSKLSVKPALLLQSSVEKGLRSSKQPARPRVIVHIDMDCFFASIAVKKNPALTGKCIAVCHGGGEISSCSYEARKFGVRAGTFFRDGRKLCPDLLSVPYEFPMYEEASIEIYSIFYETPGICVEAVSVDEAYLDITMAVGDDRQGSQSGAEALVRELRRKIFARTGCTASAGIGPSKLVARLATKAAKPNGQMRVRQENVIAYLDTLKVKDLPGIGWRTGRRLHEKGVISLPQLRALPLTQLQADFGERQGQVFYNLARALDSRPVEPLKPRKSIGAEASWGVRFTSEEEDKVRKFIMDIADEVAGRVEAAGAYGTKVVFKEYKRKKGASMVGYKHLGHGPCVVFTRSAKIQPKSAGRPLKELLRQACLRLHNDLGLCSDELRGVGVQMTDLSFADLNLDHAAGTTARSTRRIDTFFGTAAPPATTDVVPIPQEKTGTIDNANGSHTLKAESRKEVAEGNDRALDEDDSSEIKVVGTLGKTLDHRKEHVTSPVADITVLEDEDRIEPAPPLRSQARFQAPADTKARSADGTEAEDFDIPEGWDKDVFRLLPKDLQDELLRSNKRSATGGGDIRNVSAITRDVTDETEGRLKRRREREREAKASAAQAERAKRRKAAQVTMTQFADISDLKKKGHDVLNAAEFREMPLRECMELLGDLRGKPLNVRTLQTDKRGLRTRLDETGEAEFEDLEIPSPPSLSSDADSGCSVTDAVIRRGFEHVVIYEEEELSSFAEALRGWMRGVGRRVRSGHVELIRGRVLELVRRKRLERVCCEMRLVKKYAEEKGMSGWTEAYNRILDDVQAECEEVMQFRLALRRA